MIEERLEGLANRQEEFIEKLETVIREEWENQLVNPFTAERWDSWILPHFWGKLVTFLKVWREENSILVSCGLWKSGKAEITVEKTGNDLKVVSTDFEPRKLTQIVVGLIIVSLLMVYGFFIAFTGIDLFGWYTTFWFVLIAEGAMITFVAGLLKMAQKRRRKYDQALRICIESTINQFK